MYECLIGWPPFCAEDAHDTYRKIVNWRNTLYFPEDNPLMNENPQQPGGPQWPNAESCITRYSSLISPFPTSLTY